jgi:hypothetical protein
MSRAALGLHSSDSDTDGGVEAATTGSSAGAPNAFDGWLCLDFDEPDVVLSNDYSRGDCWRKIRNRARTLIKEFDEGKAAGTK